MNDEDKYHFKPFHRDTPTYPCHVPLYTIINGNLHKAGVSDVLLVVPVKILKQINWWTVKSLGTRC